MDTNKKIRAKNGDVPMPLSKENRDLLLSMIEHLKESQDEEFATKNNLREGVGLAAPQIGVNLKMTTIYYKVGEETVQYALVNPRIISSSLKQCYLIHGEGCLSVEKEHPGNVYRSNKVIVKAYDALQEKEIEITARGFDAIVLQHEIDHLNGILFYDHIDKKNPFKKIDGAIEI
jgi:peptide deformylase